MITLLRSAIFLLVTLLVGDLSAFGNSLELESRYQYWQKSAFLCKGNSSNGESFEFPSGKLNDGHDPRNPCNDNDELLFNGLLCASGENQGCKGVSASQDDISGQWYRNPQYRALKLRDPGGGGDFSEDMALGAELYSVTQGDSGRFWKWLEWLDGINPCHFHLGGYCLDVVPPLFCPGNSNCVIRPGDAAILAQVINYMQEHYGVPGLDRLPNKRLRATWEHGAIPTK